MIILLMRELLVLMLIYVTQPKYQYIKKHSILTTKFQIIYGKLQCLHLVKKNDHR